MVCPHCSSWKNEISFFMLLPLLLSLWSIDGIFEWHFLSRFLGINSSLLRLEFSALIFPFYKILFKNRLEFSCFTDFCMAFWNRSTIFFKIRQYRGLWIAIEQKTRVKLMAKNSCSRPESANQVTVHPELYTQYWLFFMSYVANLA